ncbi:MAG: hypothetical protein WBV89_00405, partial [Ilumatobacter sp.]
MSHHGFSPSGRQSAPAGRIREKHSNLALELVGVGIGGDRVTEDGVEPADIIGQHDPAGGEHVKETIGDEALRTHRTMMIGDNDGGGTICGGEIVVRDVV